MPRIPHLVFAATYLALGCGTHSVSAQSPSMALTANAAHSSASSAGLTRVNTETKTTEPDAAQSLLASSAVATDTPATTATGESSLPDASAQTASSPKVVEPTAEQDERERTEQQALLPSLDVYLPEGTFDLRLSRLIRRAYIEGQMQYNFVEGDISAFLRYRYYRRDRIHQLGIFDEVAFSALEQLSSDFSRTRGLLFLTQFPVNYHQRFFVLAELDRINSNKEELFFNNNRTNTFVRVAYQLGTPQDRRSNAIVGETRAEVRSLFSAFRSIGPGDFGVTTAATWGSDLVLGDFDYVKLEFEALKRFRVRGDNVLVGRLHTGTFLRKKALSDNPDRPFLDQFSVPRTEYFRLDGRQNLKGLSDPLRGTEQVHSTWEFAFPWFLDAERKALRATWNDWYWVLYAGYGTTGFEREVYGRFGDYLVDFGVGFEASLTAKGYQLFLSGIVAKTLNYDGDIEARLSVKTYH